MSRVITFSRTFPSYHPRAGEPTYFVEKLWESIYIDNAAYLGENYTRLTDHIPGLKNIGLHGIHIPKHHTIRAGHRWKVGDWFSPRVWSGIPYKSKQIIIGPDIQIKKLWNIELTHDDLYLINGELYAYPNSDFSLKTLAQNDGLEMIDLINWFKTPFKGQIICHNENINY